MGLVSKSAKKVNEKHKGFEPENLDERTIGAIFSRCVASKSTVNPLRNSVIYKIEWL